MSVRHFLSFMDYSPEELIGLIRRGSELKDLRNRGVLYEPLKSRVLGMVFEKASTRTRLSFEAGMIQLGGQAIFLSPRDTQLGRGEPIGDSARVMSRMLDGVMIRTFAHATLTEFAAHSKVPVMALALGERIDLSDENHLLGLFAALLAVFAVSTCGLVLGLAGLLRRSRKRHLALAGIVLNLSCLLWGWHALSTAAAAILMVLGQTGLSFLSALAVLFGMIFFRQA